MADERHGSPGVHPRGDGVCVFQRVSDVLPHFFSNRVRVQLPGSAGHAEGRERVHGQDRREDPGGAAGRGDRAVPHDAAEREQVLRRVAPRDRGGGVHDDGPVDEGDRGYLRGVHQHADRGVDDLTDPTAGRRSGADAQARQGDQVALTSRTRFSRLWIFYILLIALRGSVRSV